MIPIHVHGLLSKVKSIQNRSEKIARLQQETFNIFSILRKEHEEEKLHSAFIAALLDVKGDHGLGNIFCNLFVQQMKLDFEVDKYVKVQVEKHTFDGRIDIYLKNGKQQIVAIENKIYAVDQPQQLVRYYTHLQKKAPDSSTLLYLTLGGNEASEISITEKKKYGNGEVKEGIILNTRDHYQTISYRSDILKWLKLCLKEAVEYPTVRESIKQYITLIKKLTGQLTHHDMEREIHEEIKKNYHAARLIADNISNVQEVEVKAFIAELKIQLEEQLGKHWKVGMDDVSEKWTGLYIYHDTWQTGTHIGLQGQPKIATHVTILGIFAHSKDWDRADLNEKLKTSTFDFTGYKNSEHYPRFKYLFHLGYPEEMDKLFNKEERKKFLWEILDQVMALALSSEKILASAKRISPANGVN